MFVSAKGNTFMREIAEWITHAASEAGWPARLVSAGLPRPSGSINLVVAPHEFFELSDAPKRALQRAAAASICVCTEQPGTPWFHLSIDACRRGLRSLDISGAGVDALRGYGVDAQRLQLGAVSSMSARTAGTRSIDVLFLGTLDRRRARVLAELAPALQAHRTQISLFGFDRPIRPTDAGVVFGRRKADLLASTRILLNVHRDRSHEFVGPPPRPYFEWARVVEALANGCVVLSEPSADHAPLVPGTDFVEAATVDLGAALGDLLADPERLAAIAESGAQRVSGELALSRGIAAVLDDIERDVVPHIASHASSTDFRRGLWRLGATRKAVGRKRLAAFEPYSAVQASAKRLALDEQQVLQRLDAARCLLRHGSASYVEEVASPAAEANGPPEVTVVVTVYNYGHLVTETLDSILASTDVALEVVVVDDHSTDDSRDVVARFVADHQDAPIRALFHHANGGLAAARNAAFAAARAPLVMVMDADNLVYPRCLRALADALDADPTAVAAYATLEEFGAERGLRSAYAWDPERLCRANYIDAQAMFRRSLWQETGGYRTDDHTYGWEDWDLWLRVAAAGGHVVHVPQILGRYRVQKGSMIALTNLATRESIAALRRRYPQLPWPAEAETG